MESEGGSLASVQADGRCLDPGIREGTSLLGTKAADCAAENKASRRESCRKILSPFPPQPTW